MGFLIRLVVNAVALIIITHFHLVAGIHVSSISGAIIAALILGVVNAILRPILILISLPLEIVTLGLFTFVINGLLFWLVGVLKVVLTVDGFWAAFWGALVVSVISTLLSMVVKDAAAER